MRGVSEATVVGAPRPPPPTPAFTEGNHFSPTTARLTEPDSWDPPCAGLALVVRGPGRLWRKASLPPPNYQLHTGFSGLRSRSRVRKQNQS